MHLTRCFMFLEVNKSPIYKHKCPKSVSLLMKNFDNVQRVCLVKWQLSLSLVCVVLHAGNRKIPWLGLNRLTYWSVEAVIPLWTRQHPEHLFLYRATALGRVAAERTFLVVSGSISFRCLFS